MVISVYTFLEYISKYSDPTGSLWFYSKNEVTNFIDDIADNDNFESFKNKSELLGETAADGLNGILIAVPLKYLSWNLRSLEIPLINCIVELKLKRTNHCVLPYNTDANSNNIIFMIKNTKLSVTVVTLFAKDNQKLTKLLRKGFKDQYIEINFKKWK